jgi:phage terminase Nu1 subunit (DNA packaging protein)
MNQAQFARLHEVSKKTVTSWKNKGWVILNTDGSVDVEISNKNLELYRKEKNTPDDVIDFKVTQGNEVTDSGNDSEGNPDPNDEFAGYHEKMLPAKELNRRLTLEKLKVEREKAREAKLNADVREGRLLEADHVYQHDADVASQLQRKLLSLPSELAVRLAAINSPAEIESTLREELTHCLNEFLDSYEIEN